VRSVSPSGRVFQSRRPAPKPPGQQPGIALEKDKVTDNTDGETANKPIKKETDFNQKLEKQSDENKDKVENEIEPTKTENDSNEKLEKQSDQNKNEIENKLKLASNLEEIAGESISVENKIDKEVSDNGFKVSVVDQDSKQSQEETKKEESNETETKTDEGKKLDENEQENSKKSAENTQENDSTNEETKVVDYCDIKTQALKVLMEARKKAGASAALPRDRLAMSTLPTTADTADGSEGSASSSPKVAKKEKPPKPPPPSTSLREKLKVCALIFVFVIYYSFFIIHY